MVFEGFPEAALDFYDDLEIDNSKVFWEAHKDTYRHAVAAPMTAMTTALADEFGEVKVFRPYRDVRFAKDKTPYKTHQGAFIAVAPATGYYVEISAPGVKVAAGFYHAEAATLAAVRRAVDNDLFGPELEKILAKLAKAGWDVGGDQLKTAPRGWPKDHPRIGLLRHKSITVTKDYGFDPIIHTAGLVDRVRKDWRQTRPLVDWILAHAA